LQKSWTRRAIAAPGCSSAERGISVDIKGVVLAMAEAARRAPSAGNSQPWRLKIQERGLTLSIDPERARSGLDADGFDSWVAAGAALFNARVAAAGAGVGVTHDILTDGPGWKAVCGPLVDDVGLDPALMVRRVTDRRAYDRTPLTDPQAKALRLAASRESATLTLVQDPDRMASLAGLIAEVEAVVLLSDPGLRGSLLRWFRWSPSHAHRSGDALDVRSLDLSFHAFLFLFLVRWAPLAWVASRVGAKRALADAQARRFSQSSAMGVLTVAGDTPEDWVRGGQGLQRLWLTAEREGLAVHPLALPTALMCRVRRGGTLSGAVLREVGCLIERLAQVEPALSAATPILFLRLGPARPRVFPSERRKPADVIVPG
jgi:nitroreductase